MELFRWLENLPIVSKYYVLEHEQWATGFYFKIKIELKDQSLLFAKEYFDYSERNYSFHWQKNTGELIIRWDNAEHHKKLENFPHHKHENELVLPSEEMTLEKVLDLIRSRLLFG